MAMLSFLVSSTYVGLIAAAFLIMLACITVEYFYSDNDELEPPLVPQRIPYFGHIIGLLHHGLKYFDIISARQPHPIFTVSLVGQKTYVVTSPELVRDVQRNTKTLSFNPAMIPAFQRMLGTDEAGMKLIFEDAHTETGFYGEIHSIQKASLIPGTASLEDLSSAVRRKLMASLNEAPRLQTTNFYAWLQHLYMQANNSACFGEQDPFQRYPELEPTFWQWESNIKVLLLGLPWVLAPRSYTEAHRTRQELVAAFEEYLDDGGSDGACSFIKELCELGFRRGLSNNNSARALVGSILAIVGNTIPTTFWLLAHVFSDSGLLFEVRREIEATLPKPSQHECEIDTAQIREKCPIFISAYEEVLRMTAGIATVRYTMEDTMIADRWLLKKDSTIQMPTAFIHVDPKTWGADADEFLSERFLKTKQLSSEEHSRRAAAFRPFGGGNTLCPGRHFAFNEVISFTATVIVGFEIEPKEGTWKLPEKDRTKLPLTSLKPLTDMEACLKRRRGCETMQFR